MNAHPTPSSATRPSTEPLPVIAIDGPAASGKGTLARALSARYGVPHLDTGLTYRAVAKALMEAGEPLDDEAVAERRAAALDLAMLDREALSVHEIGQAASRVAAMPSVRATLVEAQRALARRGRGVVMDGRDIGTVVLPDALVKLFVTASPEMRARRRYDEMLGRGREDASYVGVLDDLKRRDERDTSRAVSPLRPADDAHLLDTTEMSISQALEKAVAHVEAALRRAAGHAERG